jgi:hypothetical protein
MTRRSAPTAGWRCPGTSTPPSASTPSGLEQPGRQPGPHRLGMESCIHVRIISPGSRQVDHISSATAAGSSLVPTLPLGPSLCTYTLPLSITVPLPPNPLVAVGHRIAATSVTVTVTVTVTVAAGAFALRSRIPSRGSAATGPAAIATAAAATTTGTASTTTPLLGMGEDDLGWTPPTIQVSAPDTCKWWL